MVQDAYLWCEGMATLTYRPPPPWTARARATTDAVMHRLLDTIQMVTEMRCRFEVEETITLALAEKIELMRIEMQNVFDGHGTDEWLDG